MRLGNKGQPLDQLTINDYQPGDGIPPHVDTHSAFMPAFASVSLGSGCVMTFRKFDGTLRHVFLPPRCGVVFSGEARYCWYHSIATRKLDKVDGELYFRKRRVSLTFRKVREGACDCEFGVFCNSQGFDPAKWKFDSKAQA
jgi:alkylated DNA repair protein alkB family protein 8